MTTTMLTTARTHALFVSPLSESAELKRAEIEAAIQAMVRFHHGTRGCTAEVALSYGDHPDLAVRRMQWARRMVATTFRVGEL